MPSSVVLESYKVCHQVCSSVGSRQQFSSSMPQNSATPHPPFSGHSASPPRQRGVRSPPAPFPPQPSSLSLSDRRLWRAWENHPGWLHTPSEPLNHLRNQDRTFASTSWSTAHLSSQSPARDLRPPPHRPSSRTQLGWGSGTCDPFILLDAVPRDLCSLQTKS